MSYPNTNPPRQGDQGSVNAPVPREEGGVSNQHLVSEHAETFADPVQSVPVVASIPVNSQQPAYNSPFSQSEMAMPQSSKSGSKAVLWAATGGVGVVILMFIGYLVYSSVQDPFRTLDSFPTENYLNNYESVVGSRFRAKLVVVAELGGAFDKGRLLSFRDESSQRFIAVLISPDLGQIGFSKGQSYLAEIEVREGGLIYAHAFKKN